MKLNPNELRAWTKEYDDEQERRRVARHEAAHSSKGAAPRTPAAGNLRKGSLTTLKRVR